MASSSGTGHDAAELLPLQREIQKFIQESPWRDYFPSVPDLPVVEWGTLSWARFADSLLAERRQDKERIEGMREKIKAALTELDSIPGVGPVNLCAAEQILRAALAVEEDAP